MKFTTYASATAMTLLLAGCMGSGNDVDTARPQNPGQVQEDYKARGDALTAEAAALTATTTMPTTGTATYEGIAQLVGLEDDRVTPLHVNAAMTMQADFAADTVGGKITNLGGGDERLKGEINIVDGAIKGDTFSANLEGTLQSGNEPVNTATGTLNGGFRGDNAEMVAGDIMIDEGGDDPIFNFNGTFAAEKK